MVYEWVTDDQIEEIVNPALARRGMAILNINPTQPTCRVLGAWDGNELVEFLVLQLFPVLGPMVKLSHSHRDNGQVSRDLVAGMQEVIEESDCRGFLVVADSPVTVRLCERYGMVKVLSPVFTAKDRGVECNNYTSGRAN